jgi:hypothetical protein
MARVGLNLHLGGFGIHSHEAGWRAFGQGVEGLAHRESLTSVDYEKAIMQASGRRHPSPLKSGIVAIRLPSC